MKPPHADPSHQAHRYYCLETDDYPDSEAAIEHQWREQGGVDPHTGKAWLTPRMERNAINSAQSIILMTDELHTQMTRQNSCQPRAKDTSQSR